MIEKFKTNAEVIENGDKYLYGNHVRMPLSIERGEGAYFTSAATFRLRSRNCPRSDPPLAVAQLPT